MADRVAEGVADRVRRLFQLHEGLGHLKTRARGSVVYVESGSSPDLHKHAKLTRDTGDVWVLEIADHRGRWEGTGRRATAEDLVEQLVRELGWVLTDVTSGKPWNPERT